LPKGFLTVNELKTIPIDIKYRFYQVPADHKCSVEKLQHCLLVVKSDKENGAILFDPQDGLERFQKAMSAIEAFLGSNLASCSVKFVCTDTLQSHLLSLLSSLDLPIEPVIIKNGSRVLAEPGRARIMVLPEDIIASVKEDTPKKVRVVLVDDSATIRHMLKTLLKGDEQIEVVGEADRPSVAANVIRELKPDVVTLDMNMPEKNGAEFVEEMMPSHPVPFVLVTAIGINEGDLVLRALSAGAVDYIQKPSMDEVESMRTLLLEKIKTAATAKILPRRQRVQQGQPSGKNKGKLQVPRYSANLIAIGASTGGTEAICELLVEMPKDSPPIVITQHIPPMFSTAFANRLNAICKIEVREAEDGDMIRPGLALVAPGDKHMQVVKSKKGLCVVLNQMEKVSGHRPSVDVLFRSVVDSGAQHVWGFLLTGMGKDGAEGLKALKNMGHWTAAQDEHSSVVYGMPRVAAEIGATCAIMNLHDLQNLLMNAGNVKKAG
jgi:two-component system chemotaxis response regulator CheB